MIDRCFIIISPMMMAVVMVVMMMGKERESGAMIPSIRNLGLWFQGAAGREQGRTMCDVR